MKRVFLVFLCFSCIRLYSQDSNSNNTHNKQLVFSSCNLNPFVVDDGTLGISFKDENEMSIYFRKKLRNKCPKIHQKGEILLQVLLDKNGRACCKSIVVKKGFTIEDVRHLKLQNVIKRMPKWEPGRIDGVLWNVSLFLLVAINPDSDSPIIVKRIIFPG